VDRRLQAEAAVPAAPADPTSHLQRRRRLLARGVPPPAGRSRRPPSTLDSAGELLRGSTLDSAVMVPMAPSVPPPSFHPMPALADPEVAPPLVQELKPPTPLHLSSEARNQTRSNHAFSVLSLHLLGCGNAVVKLV